MKEWKCRKRDHMVISDRRPEKIRWDDGHICVFYESREDWETRTGNPPPPAEQRMRPSIGRGKKNENHD